MLYWNILCALLMTLPLSADAMSCVEACEVCQSESQWKRREMYCAMCRECRERRRERTAGPHVFRRRPVSQINVKLPTNVDCVPLCDPNESGELYKLSIVTTLRQDIPYPSVTPYPPVTPYPSITPYPTTECVPTTCPPITCAPTALAPSTPPCYVICPPEGNYPPPNQPSYPPPNQPNYPPPNPPNYPPPNQPIYPPPNKPSDDPPYQPQYRLGGVGAQEGGKTNEPVYLYIGIPKNMQV